VCSSDLEATMKDSEQTSAKGAQPKKLLLAVVPIPVVKGRGIASSFHEPEPIEEIVVPPRG